MNVELRMFMKFKQYLPADSSRGIAIVSLNEGATVEDLLTTLHVPVDELKLVIINGISRGISDAVNSERLNDGDVVAIFPPSGGG